MSELNPNFPCNTANYRAEGYSASEAHNLARTDYRRLRQLERDGSTILRRLGGSGIPPIVTTGPEGEFEIPAIADYPRSFTPDRIAQFRESSARLIERLERDPQLALWVRFKLAAIASGCEDRWVYDENYNSSGTAYRAKQTFKSALLELGFDWID